MNTKWIGKWVFVLCLLAALPGMTVVLAQSREGNDTTTGVVASFDWVQGFAERKGSGNATQFWKADKVGNLQTHAEMKKLAGSGLKSSSDSWAEALVCKKISAQKGVYRITAVVPLNGTIATERYLIGSSAATAEVFTVIKAWQGAWPGPKGHKFMQLRARVQTNKSSNGRKDQSVNGAFTQTVSYPVTDTRLPLVVCAGQNSHARVSGYGYAWTEFVKDYGPVPTLQLSIEKLP